MGVLCAAGPGTGRGRPAGGLRAFSAFIEASAGGAAGEVARLGQVAQAIIASPEYAAGHPTNSDVALVNGLYDGALNRTPDAGRRTPDAGRQTPDAGGQAFYLEQLASGVSRSTVALEIAESAEAQVHLVGVIENGFQLVG